MLRCEFCRCLEPADKFKRSKRFCSMACAKRYNVSCRKGVRRFTVERVDPMPKEAVTRLARRSSRRESGDALRSPLHKRLAKGLEDTGRTSDLGGFEDSTAPRQPAALERDLGAGGGPGSELPGAGAGLATGNPALWTVQQVHDFISSLPGCEELAAEFRLQEIDGQALLLLKEEHLMTTMNIKLGPALKICARINLLKEV
ncbi:polyhomeotic-like protein 1 [Mobula birostris]|uniref:polyhomeotic-like protein 1 n=1 Tax=Mobula birostris TaxID=1983395 RepID=UPI003B27EA82